MMVWTVTFELTFERVLLCLSALGFPSLLWANIARNFYRLAAVQTVVAACLDGVTVQPSLQCVTVSRQLGQGDPARAARMP